MCEELELWCLATHEASERDDRVEATRIREQRDRRGQFERSRDLEDLHRGAVRGRALESRAFESEGDIFVPSRTDDRDVRAACRDLRHGGCLFALHLGETLARPITKLARMTFRQANGPHGGRRAWPCRRRARPDHRE